MSLHPDKIVSLSLLANGASPTEREPIPSSTMEQRAVNAAKTRKMLAMPKDAGAIEGLAFSVRDQHWANHLARLKRQVGQQNAKPAPKPAPQIILQMPGEVSNG